MHEQDKQLESTLILGFDIGGTKIGAVLGTLDGKILDRLETVTPIDQPFEAAFDRMTTMASKLMETL